MLTPGVRESPGTARHSPSPTKPPPPVTGTCLPQRRCPHVCCPHQAGVSRGICPVPPFKAEVTAAQRAPHPRPAWPLWSPSLPPPTRSPPLPSSRNPEVPPPGGAPSHAPQRRVGPGPPPQDLGASGQREAGSPGTHRGKPTSPLLQAWGTWAHAGQGREEPAEFPGAQPQAWNLPRTGIQTRLRINNQKKKKKPERLWKVQVKGHTSEVGGPSQQAGDPPSRGKNPPAPYPRRGPGSFPHQSPRGAMGGTVGGTRMGPRLTKGPLPEAWGLR